MIHKEECWKGTGITLPRIWLKSLIVRTSQFSLNLFVHFKSLAKLPIITIFQEQIYRTLFRNANHPKLLIYSKELKIPTTVKFVRIFFFNSGFSLCDCNFVRKGPGGLSVSLLERSWLLLARNIGKFYHFWSL